MLSALAFALLQQGGGSDLGSVGYAEIESPDALLQVGPWRAWLDSPGGELPFALEIAREGKKLSATIGNGEERIAVPETRLEGGDIVFDIPHYDSKITARIAPLGTKLDGEWKKRSGVDRWTTLKFHATAGAAPRFTPLPEGTIHSSEGRWSVHFDKGNEDGVLVLRKGPENTIEGTFLMPTGDYRWLAGSIQGHRVRLSCFDGAHAFLFDARTGIDAWAGKFWSGDRWEDNWSAEFNLNAMLQDGFDQVHWKESFGLAELLYPDLNGNEHSLGEEAFAGKAMVIQILGSWCPNCHDETTYLARVYDRYKERGLSVVGLAFEMTGEFERDAEQVRRMRERHKAAYPFLLAGLSDKKKAAEAFPALDQVFAFPTTIFLHRDGRVRAIHSGFSGPGAKEEHEKLAKRLEGIIEELLAEPDAKDDRVWNELPADAWRDQEGKRLVRFLLDDGGKKGFVSTTPENDRTPNKGSADVVNIRGNTVVLGNEVWRFDPRTRDLIDPRDFGRRLLRASRPGWDPTVHFDSALLASEHNLFTLTSLVYEAGRLGNWDAGPSLVECTKSGFASLRREAARAIGGTRYVSGEPELRALLRDVDPLVRKAAEAALKRLPNR